MDKHYENATGVSIPKNTLYMSYVDHYFLNRWVAINTAIFGKVNIKYYCYI